MLGRFHYYYPKNSSLVSKSDNRHGAVEFGFASLAPDLLKRKLFNKCMHTIQILKQPDQLIRGIFNLIVMK